MFRLLFCAVVISTGLASPMRNDVPECPKNQDPKVFFKVDPEQIKWDYVTSEGQMTAVLNNKNHMIVIDVDVDDQDQDLIISEGYPLKAFMEKLVEAAFQKIKKGLKINVKSTKAFEKFIYKNEKNQELRNDDPLELYPFPLWFHINVDDPNGLLEGVSGLYDTNKKLLNCYTFSLGWEWSEDCAPLVDNDITEMITYLEKFSSAAARTVVIDAARLPSDENICKLWTEAKSLHMILNEKNIKCSTPKSLSGEINTIKGTYEDSLFIDVSNSAETHMKLCDNSKKIIDSFESIVGQTNFDLTELKWKTVSRFEDLSETIEEDMISIDVEELDEKPKFLGKDFKTFIDEFLLTNKGLQLNFKTEKAYEAYWNIEHDNFVSYPGIPISVRIDVKTADSLDGIDLIYQKNKWLSCYSTFYSTKGGDDKYEDAHITNLIEAIEDVESEEITFSLDTKKILQTSPEAIQKIFVGDKYNLHISNDATDIVIDDLRELLAPNLAKTFLDIKPELREELKKTVPISKLVPDVEEHPEYLKFQKSITTLVELEEILTRTDEKEAIQINLVDNGGELVAEPTSNIEDPRLDLKLTECIKRLNKDKKHLIKLHFKTEEAFKTAIAKHYFKYLNFPVWIHLDVDGTAAIDLKDFVEDLKKIDHSFILGWTGLNSVAMETQIAFMPTGKKITYAIQAGNIIANIVNIDALLKKHTNHGMLISLLEGQTIISKNLRKQLEAIGRNKYFIDIPNRNILEGCPENRGLDFLEVGEDLSTLKFSKFVENKEDLEQFLGEPWHFIRANVVLLDGALYVHDKNFKLSHFFENFIIPSGSSNKGIIFTFKTTEDFEEAMAVNDMKVSDYPIWFDVEVAKAGTDNKLVVLNYDKYNDCIDCRILLLGLKIEDDFPGYSETDVNNLRFDEIEDKLYSIRAEFLVDSWEELQKLFDQPVGGEVVDPSKNKILAVLPADSTTKFISHELRSLISDAKTNTFLYDFLGKEDLLLPCPEYQDLAKYFEFENVFAELEISEFVQNYDDLIKKLGESHMIRAKIGQTATGLYVGEDLGLDEFFNTFEETSAEENRRNGIIFSIESTKIFDAAMVSKMKTLNIPIWFDIEIENSDGKKIVDVNYDRNNDKLDCRTLLLGIQPTPKFTKYTPNHISKLTSFPESNLQSKTVLAIRAEFVKNSWDALKVSTNDKLVFVPTENIFITRDFREFAQKEIVGKIYSDFGNRRRHAATDCPDDFHLYFKDSINNLSTDLSNLYLSDPVTSKAVLGTLINANNHMLKATVTLNNDPIPIPIIAKDYTLSAFLLDVNDHDDKSKFGLRLTFDTTETFDIAASDYAILSNLRNMKRPIWINALIVGEETNVELNYTLNNDLLDCSMLSLGWSGTGKDKYSEPHIQAMKNNYVVASTTSPIMYVVDLIPIASIWKNLADILLSKGNMITLTSTVGELGQLDYSVMKDILIENKGILLYDMPALVREQLGGGCAALTSSLSLALVFLILPMILH